MIRKTTLSLRMDWRSRCGLEELGAGGCTDILEMEGKARFMMLNAMAVGGTICLVGCLSVFSWPGRFST